MSDINTDKQSETSSTNSFGSIGNILKIIDAAFAIPDEPLTPIPPPLLLIGGVLRTGLSADDIAAKIISRQSEAGLLVGNAFADGGNSIEQMELIRIQEIINAIMLKAKVEVVVPLGIAVSTVGVGNLGAPVISFGSTTSIGTGYGIIR